MNEDWEITEKQTNNDVTKKTLDLILSKLNDLDKKISNLEKNQDKIKNDVNFKLNDLEFNIKKSNKSKLQYHEIMKILQQNKKLLKTKTKDIEKLNSIIDNLKKNNDKITNNLSTVLMEQRNDNAFWRSYSNNFNKKLPSFLTNILI